MAMMSVMFLAGKAGDATSSIFVTTAIDTGWKMLGGSDHCELSYHKETRLLIVVADVEHTGTVIKALEALRQARPKPTLAPPNNKSSADPAPGQ